METTLCERSTYESLSITATAKVKLRNVAAQSNNIL
jgi:hypothetical protein